MELYVIVAWPDIKYFMSHKDWDKCRMLHPNETNLCEYIVPLELYKEVYGNKEKKINL